MGYAGPMARIRLFHWNEAEAQPTLERLRAGGHEIEYQEKLVSGLFSSLKRMPPDAVLIDLSRLPSHGLEVAIAIRGSKSTRRVPLVFAGGAPEKLEPIRAKLPDAVYCEPAKTCEAIRSALESSPANPVVPVQMMDRFGARTVCQKLGIGEGSTVRLIDPPRGLETILAPLPECAQFTEDESARAAITLWFVRDRYALEHPIRENRRLASNSKLWILWPKHKGKSKEGINETFIRETALAVALVDYKVCCVDQTWSGMLFARRKVAR